MSKHYCYFGLGNSETTGAEERGVAKISETSMSVVHLAGVGKVLASDEETDREDTIQAISDSEFQAMDE